MGKKGRGNLSRDRGGRRKRVPRRRGHHRPCSGRRGAGRCGCHRRPSQRRGTLATPHGSAAGVQARPAGNRAICYAARAEIPLLAAAASRSAEAMEDRHGRANAEGRAKLQIKNQEEAVTVSPRGEARSKTETSQARELKRSDVCGRHVWAWPRDYFMGRTSPKKPKISAHKTQFGDSTRIGMPNMYVRGGKKKRNKLDITQREKKGQNKCLKSKKKTCLTNNAILLLSNKIG